jgi:signal transduction histidine kinase/ActR/RegA family two-component response regulator
MLSLAIVTSCLTGVTLLIVRRSGESRVQREIQEESRNAMMTFHVLQHQHQVMLIRKADLLASLVSMRNGDPSAIDDVSNDPWQTDECDLLVLADAQGKIVALHSTAAAFPTEVAQDLLAQTLRNGSGAGWWYSGTRLYQVVLKPFYDGAPAQANRLGTVIVGRGIDPAANELRHMSSSQLAFRYGNDIVASTLPLFEEREFARQLGRSSSQQSVTLDGERFFVSSSELAPGTHPVSLIVLKSYKEALAYLEKETRLLAEIGLLAVLLGGALVFVISDRFTQPLGSLVRGVLALEQGDYSYPLKAESSDEVGRVTRAFSRMRSTLQNNESQKQQLEEQLRQSQKMEAIGRLAGGVAHDFNNLLTIIKGHGDLMLDRLQPNDPVRRNADQIEKAADRAASLTRQLLAFSRMQVLEPKILDLNALVSEMCNLLKRLVREDISFAFLAGASLGRVKADPGQIEQVIMNLTVNACDAMPQGGKLIVETRNVIVDEALAKSRPPLQPGEYVRLMVEDTGHGMDSATKARIFEPFFTTKELGKGTGLGLATVYGVVKQSGGCIWVDSELGEGARFEVYLPVVHAKESHVTGTTVTAAAPQRSELVLIVEDEDAVRDLAAEFMKAAGYQVLTARDGHEALGISTAQNSAEPIRILLTDIVMPRMRGPELSKSLKALLPELKVIYMSGYLEFNKATGEFLDGSYFLQKPFSRETLVSKIDETLSEHRSKHSSTKPTIPKPSGKGEVVA